MATQYRADQQLYTGRGPLDAKSLIKTYAELLNVSTWTKDDTLVAYNGMIVAVWLDKVSAENNGIYYLFDPTVTTALKKPDVTKSENWHKISESVDVSSIEAVLADYEDRISALETEDRVHNYGYRRDFPEEGKQNHIYVAADLHRTYVFVGGQYIHIADSFEYTDDDNNPDTPEVRIIYGGNAN